MKAVVGFAEGGKFTRGIPVEPAPVNQQAADDDAVAAQELGSRVHDQVRPQLQRLQQVGRGESRVHQQRQLRGMGDGGYRLDVQYIQARVANGLGKDQAGIVTDGGGKGLRVTGIDKRGLDAEARQGIGEQVVAATVQGAGGDDV